MNEFLLNFATLLEINTTPEAAAGQENWARIAAGISGLDPATNDEVDQTKYMDGEGYGSSDVTGGQLTIALSGHRDYADPAQNFIFGRRFGFGGNRKTTARVTYADGGQVQGSITIANITGPGGDAGAKGDIGFEIHFNGKPAIVDPAAAPAFAAVFAAGTANGTTKATGAAGAENRLLYALYAANPGTPNANVPAPDTGIAYTSAADITAAVGQYLAIYEINAYNRIVKFAGKLLAEGDVKAPA